MDLFKNHMFLLGFLQGRYAYFTRRKAVIHQARIVASTNQELQLELDRVESEVENALELVANLMFEIPRNN